MALKKAAPKEVGEPVTKEPEAVAQEPAVVVEPVTQEPAEAVTSEPEPEVTQEQAPVVTEEPEALVEPVTQEPEPEVTEEPTAVVTQEPEAEAPRASHMVEVLNLCDGFLQQPSTGIRIGANEVKELKADGWLEGQIDAKLLKLV